MGNRFFQISAFFFFYFALVGVYVIFLPKILQSVGYTPAQIGIVFSIAPLMRFITPFFFLKHFALTDRVFHAALVTMLITVGLFYLSIDHFVWFALSNVVYGVSSGLVLPYVETYAIEKLGKARYGRSRLFGSIGFIFVALLLARILDNPATGLHAVALTTIFAVLFAWLTARNNRQFNRIDSGETVPFNLFGEIPLWVSIFLMQVSFGAFYSFFTIYESEHGLSLETISYLWTSGVLCEVVLFYFQGRFLRYPLLSVIRFTIFMTTLRWLLLFLFPDSLALVFLSQSIHALSFALYHSATLTYLNKIYEDRKLAAQFYYGIGFGLGGFTGSLLAGYFYGPYLFLFSAVVALLAFVSLFPLFHFSKKRV